MAVDVGRVSKVCHFHQPIGFSSKVPAHATMARPASHLLPSTVTLLLALGCSGAMQGMGFHGGAMPHHLGGDGPHAMGHFSATPLPGDDGPCGTHDECLVIFHLFSECGPDRKGVINRNVQLTDEGYTARTTSDNATVAALLQSHVEHMRVRVRDHRPMNTWDPLFAALFNASTRGELDVVTKNLTDGVFVNETGRTPCSVAVLQEHSGEVSKFVTRGIAEMRGPAHPVPAMCPWAGTRTLGATEKPVGHP